MDFITSHEGYPMVLTPQSALDGVLAIAADLPGCMPGGQVEALRSVDDAIVEWRNEGSRPGRAVPVTRPGLRQPCP